MAQSAIGFGLVLVVIGVGGWLGTGRASVTALIPAFIGVVIAALGAVALRPGARKHAMHAVAALAALGIVGSLFRIVKNLVAGAGVEWTTPAVLQVVTAAVLAVLLVLCVRSFLAARRSAG